MSLFSPVCHKFADEITVSRFSISMADQDGMWDQRKNRPDPSPKAGKLSWGHDLYASLSFIVMHLGDGTDKLLYITLLVFVIREL